VNVFLNSLNNFRALAIVFIVAGHTIGLVNIDFDNHFAQIIKILISGGTFLFVFISGFLFHHIFYKKFKYKHFMLAKAKNVLLPYLILGALPVFFYVTQQKDVFDGFFLPVGDGTLNTYIIPTLKYYWTGAFLNAYWYIPFVLIVFICSPLHALFIRTSIKPQLIIIILLSIISLFIHRPVSNLSVLQSVIYFTPVYLIGIQCSINKSNIYRFFENKEFFLLAIAVTLAVIQSYSGVIGNYHKLPFEYGGIDLMFLQKIVLSIFFMVWLHRFEDVNNKFLHTLAATSFTVFFIHPYILWVLSKYSTTFYTDYPWLVSTFLVVMIIACCITIALLMRKFLPRISRNIIGY
jgi:hypothetical protein